MCCRSSTSSSLTQPKDRYCLKIKAYGKFNFLIIITFPADEHDEHLTACLLMVFVAVSIPKLARSEHSFYRASLEGHANNVHCVAAAVNAVFGALFTVCSAGAGPGVGTGTDPTLVAGAGSDIEDRMKEFLAVSILL